MIRLAGMTDQDENATFWQIFAAIAFGFLCIGWLFFRSPKEADVEDEDPRPLSVNYHFTRRCNYQCGFCFHTAKSSFVLPMDEAKRGLLLLKEAGKLAVHVYT